MFRRGLKSLLWHDEKNKYKILAKSIVRTFCEKEGRLKIFTFIACDKSKVKKSVLTRHGRHACLDLNLKILHEEFKQLI